MTELQTPASVPELRPAFIAELRNVEVVLSGNTEDLIFTGTAVVYDASSEPLWTPRGSFRETILKGAFDEVLERSDVELLYNHNPDSVMARTSAGTLELTNTDEGLHVWARLDPSDPDAQRLESKMRRQNVTKMSFAFGMDEDRGAEDRWYEDDDGGIHRDVVSASDLFDVSAVGRPAYTQTKAALRTLEAAAEAGKITLPPETPNQIREAEEPPPVAQAETDPAGEKSDPISAQAETDPAVGEGRDVSAEAETDPPVGGVEALKDLKRSTREQLIRERTELLRLSKEASRL